MGYITKKGAQNIATYKASATVDNSLIYNYCLSPLCDYSVQFIPTWVAYVFIHCPIWYAMRLHYHHHQLTALGFICLVLSSLLSLLFVGVETDKSDSEVAPVALASAVLIFSYMFLDNTDGKQARRTKTSSPLGELIDHGCDAMTIGLGAINIGVLIGIDGWSILIISVSGSIPFYLAHWEEYFTHSLTLGMVNGPTETETLAIVVFLITSTMGMSWWKEYVTLGNYTLRRNMIIVYLGVVMGLTTALLSVVKGLRKARAQGVSILSSFKQLLPITIVWTCTLVWIFSYPLLFVDHPTLFITAFGFVFATLVGRCIVQRICSEPYRLFYPIIIPLVAAAANSVSGIVLGKPVVDGYTMLIIAWWSSFLGWTHFVVSIINEMCKVLHISAFTIPYKSNKAR